ncbi:unnamed protein product [Acanthosepion pharaonis]|uniref:Reverse transcriptase n=1 Tax=Acanthosepion pharaonis TaxID=158019 RepID=A0A812ESM8_ACAPH|nr:unnamed protein product [Sepia pharaonis]
MVLRPNDHPIVHATRKCPIHMRDEIKAELDGKISQRIIRKVDEPTDWVNSIVYVRKSNGKLRLFMSQDVCQQRMDMIIEKCTGALALIDEVIIHRKTKEEDDLNLRKLMETARTAGLTFNSSKCAIDQGQLKFFGAIFDRNGIHPDPQKAEEIKSLRKFFLSTPRNFSEDKMRFYFGESLFFCSSNIYQPIFFMFLSSPFFFITFFCFVFVVFLSCIDLHSILFLIQIIFTFFTLLCFFSIPFFIIQI